MHTSFFQNGYNKIFYSIDFDHFEIVDLLVIIACYNLFTHKNRQQAHQQPAVLVISHATTIVTLTNKICQSLHRDFSIVV